VTPKATVAAAKAARTGPAAPTPAPAPRPASQRPDLPVSSLDAIFRPASVAVVGASTKPGSIGREIVHNLILGDFKGKLFPVNPKAVYIHSIKAYPSILDIPDPVDMAVIVVPAAYVLDVVDECGRKGVKGLKKKMGKRTVTSGCGQGTVYGDLMQEIDQVKLRADVTLADEQLFVLIEKVRKYETIYKQAGAVHGCALATRAGEILMFVEDVGRHNAVDAIAGFMWLKDIDGSDKVFYTTGRLTSEMVIKCAQMRIPFLVSRSGLTQMGYAIAQKVGITMLGRASGRHYLAFTGRERLLRQAPQPTAYA